MIPLLLTLLLLAALTVQVRLCRRPRIDARTEQRELVMQSLSCPVVAVTSALLGVATAPIVGAGGFGLWIVLACRWAWLRSTPGGEEGPEPEDGSGGGSGGGGGGQDPPAGPDPEPSGDAERWSGFETAFWDYVASREREPALI